jgi:aspartyl-tRNA(Asn)/glutamyl-tRNA(Gln) amidotransferase subunit A
MRDAGETVSADLADLSVADLGAGFRAGAFTPVDALESAFARLDAFDGAVNAFVFQDRATSRAMAVASAARHAAGQSLGLLDGVPVSVKDLTPVAGWPNRRGSAALNPTAPAPEDAPAVARLREAGAVFLGKTATPESGSRIVTRSPVHGVTRNPFALDRTPGGSSGGAAAALALGMGTLATGTDGAGSIRIPAAFCNLVGIKPGFGRVPSWPPSHFMPHSVTGPMARRIDDLSAMLAVMAGAEPRDPFAWPVPFDLAATRGDIAGLRVALSPDLGTGRMPGTSILSALDRVAAALSDAGVHVETISPAWPAPPHEPFDVFWTTSYAGFLDLYPPEQAARMAPLLHEIAARGRAVDTTAYHRALNQRLALTAASHAFLGRFDAVLCPSVIGAAFDVMAEAPPGETPDDWSWCPYAYVFNMTGQPALAVPAGFDADGLPLGVQIAARSGREEMLLRLGRVVEAALDLVDRRPPLLAAGETGHDRA